MNERILELANEANKDIGYTFKMEEAKQLHELMEKFAELIIKECATLTLEPMQKSDAQYYHGWLDYRDKIWKHFGVEE